MYLTGGVPRQACRWGGGILLRLFARRIPQVRVHPLDRTGVPLNKKVFRRDCKRRTAHDRKGIPPRKGHAVGSTPLAVSQEDLLVFICIEVEHI